MQKNILKTLSLLVIFQLAACVPMNDGSDIYGNPNYGRGSDPYYDPYSSDYEWRERERIRREREMLRDERRDLERERERLEQSRREAERPRPIRPTRPKPIDPNFDRCPSGFYPSDRKCTDKERKRGCKDLRAPSGRLCVAGR